MIVCAAIKIIAKAEFLNGNKELVVCGLRHGNCLDTITQLEGTWKSGTKIQGFINHKGEFLDRKAALVHARECGQLTATHRYYQEDHNINELYSEDLY